MGGIIAVAAFCVWRWRQPPEGFITSLTAIDETRAVISFRANYDHGPSRGWVALIDSAKGPVWWHELPGLPLLYEEITCGDGVVTARFKSEKEDDGVQGTLGIDLATGKELWRTELTRSSREFHEATLYLGSLSDGPQLLELVSDSAGTAMVALERKTGRIEWRRQLSEREEAIVVRPILTPEFVVLSREHDAIDVFRRSDGAVATSIRGFVTTSCMSGATVSLGHLGEVRQLDLDTVTDRRLVSPIPTRALANQVGLKPDLCGTRAGELVLALDSDHGSALLGIDAKTGAFRWEIPLGAVELRRNVVQSNLAARRPGFATLDGELPRFVGLIVADRANERRLEWLVVDLTKHEVSERRICDPAMLYPSLFQHDDGFFLARGAKLARFGAETGRLEATTVLPFAAAEPRFDHLVAGAFWVYSSRWGAMSKAPWMVLDAKTLRPLHTSMPGMRVRDDRQYWEKMLGPEVPTQR
jgi:outer membrane protein assembly factor BamB